jgi:hypothetical protein
MLGHQEKHISPVNDTDHLVESQLKIEIVVRNRMVQAPYTQHLMPWMRTSYPCNKYTIRCDSWEPP